MRPHLSLKNRQDSGAFPHFIVLRAILLLLAAGELFRAVLFLVQDPVVYKLIGRQLVDPVIGRQYGLFLLPAVLLYLLLALDPARFAWMLWVGVIQRGAEALLALSDWATGALATPTLLAILLFELLFGGVLAASCWHVRPGQRKRSPNRRRRWMRRVLLGFGGLFLFWAIASTVLVPIGSWLLSYPINDLYITRQQGIGFLVLSMTSLFAAVDVERYRLFILVPLSSQLFGVLNAIYEVQVGTIPLQAALVQWIIQAILSTAFLWFYPWRLSGSAHSVNAETALHQP